MLILASPIAGPHHVHNGINASLLIIWRLLTSIVFEMVLGPGYSSTGFFKNHSMNGTMVSTLPTSQSDVALPGTGGRILAVW